MADRQTPGGEKAASMDGIQKEQKDYGEFSSRIPRFFQNNDFMNAITSKIHNNGTSQIDHEKLKERGAALVQKWSEDTTIEDWTADDSDEL